VVDRARRRPSPSPAHRHASQRRAGLRVPDQARRAHGAGCSTTDYWVRYSLSEVIECPLHFAIFDVRTGKLLSGPTAADVPTYQVQVEDDTVYVKRSLPP
jgi:hypothetical protein